MKSNSLFVASRERHAGSLLISLGLMSILRQHFEKIVFFKPLISKLNDPDQKLIQEYFQLDVPVEDTYGLTLAEATEMLSNNQKHALFEKLVAKFQQLQKDYDFVLVQGVEMDRYTSGFEFDINFELAKHFNSAYFPVLNGQDKTLNDIKNEIEMELHMAKNLSPFAFFINRLNPDLTTEPPKLKLPENLSVFYLAEIEDLNTPTVKEIADALEGTILSQKGMGWNRLAKAPVVAAMTVENYLPRVKEGDLVIVPGDRSDILMASVMSLFVRSMSNIAGIMLTGGLQPKEIVKALTVGFQDNDLPIVSVPTDTYTTAMKASQVRAKLNAKNPRKINIALGLFDQSVDRAYLMEKLRLHTTDHSKDIMTPIMFEYGLFEKARRDLKTIVLPEAHDPRILKACDILIHRQVVKPILLGKVDEIHYQCNLLGIHIENVEIIDPETSPWREEFIEALYKMRKHKGITRDVARDSITHVSYFATMMVHLGYADGMVSGATHTTADTIRPALQIIKTQPNVSLVSSVFLMCFDTRVLVYGDCAVNQNPDADALADIAISSAETAKQFEIDPKVALLSYSTGKSGQGHEVEKVRNASELAKQKRPDLLIEGPLQYDAAIDKQVAQQKMPDSQVAGEATVFIFPDLNTGNNTYKAVQRASGAIAIGPVLQGLRKPINDLSRGCTVADIVNTVAITAIQAQANQNKEAAL